MLDLVRLSPRLIFPPGGVDLYRQIALLTEMREGTEVLAVGCGKAVPLEYWVNEFGVHASGVEADARLVASVVERARRRSLADRLQVQCSSSDALPYRDGIFDVAIGEVGMTADADPAAAIRELVRVTRPGGSVVLVQLVWRAPVDASRRQVFEEHLGVRPQMLVEWKRLLREHAVEQLHTEDWTDPTTAFRSTSVKPFPDFAELFSLPEKLGILRRAWGRWGWSGVRAVLARERAVHRLLTRERVLSLDLIKGMRAGPAIESMEQVGESADLDMATPAAASEDSDQTASEPVEGLPLFEGDWQ